MHYHAWLLCVFNLGMFLFWFCFWLLLLLLLFGCTLAQLPCPVFIQACPNLRSSSLGGQLGWATSRLHNTVHLSPGVLLDVQKYFYISDSHAGLLQTGKEPFLDPRARTFCHSLVSPASGSRP